MVNDIPWASPEVLIPRIRPAAQAGLLVGDILVGLAGAPVTDPDDLLTRLVGAMVGQPALLQVLRGGQPVEFTVIIGERK